MMDNKAPRLPAKHVYYISREISESRAVDAATLKRLRKANAPKDLIDLAESLMEERREG